MPLRIGIDARVIGRRGVGRYLASLVGTMAPISPRDTFVLFAGPKSDTAALPSGKNVFVSELPPGHPAWIEQRVLPAEALRQGCDLLHFPDNTASLWPRLPTVLTLHDTMWQRALDEAVARPSLALRLQDLYRKWICPRAAAAASRLITVSRDSRSKIEVSLDVDPDRVAVVPEALPPVFKTRLARPKVAGLLGALGLKGPFVLTSGAADKRKNVDRLVRAFALASRRNKKLAQAKLVVASLRPGEQAATTYAETAARHGVEGRLAYPGYVSDEQMKALYQGALCFAFPSLWEGFGIPVLEAFSMGCPVLASTAGALPETAGRGALLVNPKDELALAAGLVELAKPARAAFWKKRGRGELKRFSWDRAAKRTLEVYAEAAARS